MSIEIDRIIPTLQVDTDYMPLDSLEMSIGIIEELQKLNFSKIITLCENNDKIEKKQRAWGKLNGKFPKFKKALVRLYMESLLRDEDLAKAVESYVSNLKNFHLKTIQEIPRLIETMKEKFTFEIIQVSQ